jgi:NAD(P)-dependent dehydrogenase (short-subunit alcohol dehydrogenase family)
VSLFSRLLLSPPRCASARRLRSAIAGKTVLITGASFGIGEASSHLLADAGATVLLVARTKEKLGELVEQIRGRGGQAFAYPGDLYHADQMSDLATRIQAAHPRVDLVISNAGKSIRRRIINAFERTDLERSLAVNFSSPAALIMALLPRMIEQGGGQIINVSSVSARQPGAPRWSAYQGSKAGFDVWLRSLACELRPRKIFISSIYMPLVRTRMIAPSGIYDRVPALTPLEAAQVIARAAVKPADRIAPWWLWWCELAVLCFGTLANRMLTALDHRRNP